MHNSTEKNELNVYWYCFFINEIFILLNKAR
jgi:hypothetical protein